jgi:hypothetical protein
MMGTSPPAERLLRRAGGWEAVLENGCVKTEKLGVAGNFAELILPNILTINTIQHPPREQEGRV